MALISLKEGGKYIFVGDDSLCHTLPASNSVILIKKRKLSKKELIYPNSTYWQYEVLKGLKPLSVPSLMFHNGSYMHSHLIEVE